jgi:hypothetical protein
MATTPTGIAVKAKIFPIAFIMLLFKPIVEIDGQPHEGAWSDNFFPVGAGNHSVTVYWKYFWFLPSNRGTINVTVADGQAVNVLYQARWLVFLPGKISVTS